VDPVPAGGGMINGNTRIGFDSKGRVILSYHKYDADGNTQVYNARREKTDWKIYQVSHWNVRWEFKGGGSIPFLIHVGAPVLQPDGTLLESYENDLLHVSGAWRLDDRSLAILPPAKQTPDRPAVSHAQVPQSTAPGEAASAQADFPGMEIRRAWDSGAGKKGVRYEIEWEALGPNRDRPRTGPLPPPSMLRLKRWTTN
jgi:hypothetical protein